MGSDLLSPGESIVLGIGVGLVSTSVQSLGLTLQRKSHIIEEEKGPNDLRRPPHKRRRWQLGMLMFILANLVGSSIQITTLPLPILSPLQASGLVFNSICATLILGEPFTRLSLTGTVLVCAGAMIIAMFGAMKEPAHSLDELLFLLSRSPFVIWMIGQALLVIIIIVGARLLKSLKPRTINNPRMRLVRGIAYGSLSGILSAHSLLVAKSAVELLVRTVVDRANQFNRWQSWMILLGLIGLALSQLYYLHCGLKLCSTSVLYPLVFCIYNIVAILDGLIYFQQTSKLSVLSALLIALGTFILLSGVLALSWRLNDEPAPSPTGQGALVTGMPYMDSPTDDEVEDLFPSDEETATRRHLLHSSATTPTTNYDTILSATRLQRRGMTEADEIWGELEDDATRFPSPMQRRSTSGTMSISRLRREVGDDTVDSSDVRSAIRPLVRAGSSRVIGHRNQRRRMPPWTRWRASSGDHQAPRPRPQGALGGWWKLEWWKSRRGRNREDDRDP